MYTYQSYLIETMTNTHVGTGDTTFGPIDKMIQRDTRTGFPVIHASSIKGALKDHFMQYMADDCQNHNRYWIAPHLFYTLFGEDEKDTLKKMAENCHDEVRKKEIQWLLSHAPRQGLITFFDAHILTIPLRSTKKVFHHATCPHAAIDYLSTLIQFNMIQKTEEVRCLINFFEELQTLLSTDQNEFIVFSNDDPAIEDYHNSLCLSENQQKQWSSEDFSIIRNHIATYFSPSKSGNYLSSFAVFHDDLFKSICETGLPVIARNKISDKGTSENLFYEEILPRRSVLWFMTGTYCLNQLKAFANRSDSFSKIFKDFHDQLLKDYIQLGANASIGYGLTVFNDITKKEENNHEQA